MSKVRQQQIFDGANGTLHYEITFTALAHDWIPAETYEEISDMIDTRILRPESFEAQTAYDALTDMMTAWRMVRHTCSQDWKDGFIMAWIAAGGAAEDLINTNTNGTKEQHRSNLQKRQEDCRESTGLPWEDYGGWQRVGDLTMGQRITGKWNEVLQRCNQRAIRQD